MGFVKAQMMEDDENGFRSGGDKHVCEKHFDDPAINKFIRRNLTKHRCSYCHRTNSVHLDKVMKLLLYGVMLMYKDAADGTWWDDELHKYIPEPMDTLEVLYDEYSLDINPLQLDEDIRDKCIDISWSRRNQYTGTEDEWLKMDWDFFCNTIKYSIRFVFYKTQVKRNIDGNEYFVAPYTILNTIGKAIHKLNLYKRIEIGGHFFRARQHCTTERVCHSKQLGPPPIKKAKSSRFSPAGIPMFYASSDEETAIQEVIDKEKKSESITTGTFTNTRALNFVDLTDLPRISIFDKKRNKFYLTLNFLRQFISDISQPVKPDGSEHIDYVPTQVITEYFRHLLTKEYKVSIDGIQYHSVKNSGGLCYVLFFDENSVTQDNEDFDYKKPLSMKTMSLRTIPVSAE